MDLSDGIAGLALLVSIAAFATPLLRNRRAEPVVSWEARPPWPTEIVLPGQHGHHTLWVDNLGPAPARDVEVVLLMSGREVDIPETDDNVLRASLIASRHRVGLYASPLSDGRVNGVKVTWADGRRGRHTQRSNISAAHLS